LVDSNFATDKILFLFKIYRSIMKKNLHIFLLFSYIILSHKLSAVNYYWVGGTGNWSDINKWSLTSGGAGGAGVPGVNDNVFFTQQSFTAANQTVTLNVANANCNNMTWSNTSNTPIFASSAAANNLNIYGNLTMTAAQGTWATGMNVYFMGTGTKTINSGGKTFGPVYFAGTGTWSNAATWTTGVMNVTQAATLNFGFPVSTSSFSISAAAQVNFQVGATGTITGSLTIEGNGTVNFLANRTVTSYVYLNHGTLNTNSTTQTWTNFRSRPCNTTARTMNLGSSTINVTGTVWELADFSYMTLNAGTSTINMQAVSPTFNNYLYCYSGQNTATYYNVNFTATSGTANLYNEYSTATSRILGNFNQISFSAGGNVTGDITVNTINFALNGTYTFQAGRTVTVNTIFNANATCAGPMTLRSGTAGTQAIISKATATVTMNYCNLQDMNFIGGATATATNSINQGNNTGVTIQAGGSATSRSLYWVGGTGNWNDVNRWSLTSGGAGGQCPPTSIDDVFFTQQSFTAANQTVTMNVPNADCRNMTWSNTSNTPIFASSAAANNLNIYGSLTMTAAQGTWATGMNVYFMGIGVKTINSGGKTFGPVYFAGTGTWSNAATWTTGLMNVTQAATLNFGFPVSTSSFLISAAAQVNFQVGATGTITGSLTIDGNGTVNFLENRTVTSYVYLNHGTLNTNSTTQTWTNFRSRPCNTTARTMNLGSSTINVTGTVWELADFSYMTLNAGTSTINMQAVSPTFNNYLYCYSGQNTATYYNVNFTATSGTANLYNEYSTATSRILGNFNQINFSAGGNITGDVTVNTINFALNGTYTFQAGRTVTVNTLFNANATCAGPMTLRSGTAGTQAIISKATATVTMNYCNLQDMNFIGGATATATNSINQGNNTGVTIQAGGSAASRSLYWVGGTGNWNDVNRWSLTSGGAGGQCPPTSIDDVFFTQQSFTAANQMVTMNVPNADCRNMTWSNTSNTPIFASSAAANNLNIYGSLTMTAAQGTWATGMNVYFMGTGTKTINSGGKTFGPVYFAGTGTWSNAATWTTGLMNVTQAATLNFGFPVSTSSFLISAAAQVNFQVGATGTITGSLTIDGNGTVNFLENRTVTSYVYLNHGTLNTNSTTQTWTNFRSRPCNTTARTMNLGSSTINVTGTVWELADFSYMTLNAGTSTINMQAVSPTFNNYLYCYSGQNTATYYNVNFTATSGTANLYNEYSTATSRILGNFNQINFSAGGNVTGDLTIGTLILTSNNSYNFQSGRTVTITNNISFGSICFGGVTLQSSTAGSQAIISKSSGIVNGQNLTIKDLNATGGATFNAYGSTNMGNNTGWNFITSPTLGTIGAINQIIVNSTYSITPVTGAVTYTWTVPAGATITGGQGTDNITFNLNGQIGQICVTASNGCGSTTSSSCLSIGTDFIPLNTMGVFVSENFNTLATTGTSTILPVGWNILETGTNANNIYTAGTGSSNAGDSYSFGLSSDRSLGGLLSGSLTPSFGAKYLNNTGATITTLTVTYQGETWRVGAALRTDKIDFQYSTNATSLSTGTWTNIDSLDYENIAQATAPLSGSLLHSGIKNYTFGGLNIPAGSNFWIKWTDLDVTGSDDGIGVNNYSIKPCGTISAPTTVAQSFCTNQNATVANLSATGTNIQWYNSSVGGNVLSASEPLVTGVYYASQTISGCESFNRTATNVTINTNPTASVTGTNVICSGSSTTFTASGGSTYLWSTGAATATITASTAQTYNVTVTNAAGCSASTNTTLTVNANPTATVTGTNTICSGQSTAFTASGGTSYLWSTGAVTASITASTAQTYNVTVTDANGCTATSNRTLTIANPTAVIAGINAICSGSSTTLTASGGSTYLWSTGAVTSAITVTTAQTYNVTVTDANGCTATSNRTLTVSANPTAAVTGTNTICSGASTTFTASGGTSYLWSTGATTASITASTAQTYNVTVTDVNGCTASSNRTLTVNASPALVISGTNSICAGTSTTFTASGGTSYIWSTGATTATITASTAQTYNVTATNTSGCTATSNTTLIVNTNPTAVISGTNAVCTGLSTTFTASGGTSYLWSTGAVTAAITVNTVQTYNVTVTNAAGCTATSNITLTNVIPSPTVAGTSTICSGLSTTLTASSGTDYNWYSNPSGTNLILSGATFTTPALSTNTTYYVSNIIYNNSGTYNYTAPVQLSNLTGGDLIFNVSSVPTNPTGNAVLTVYAMGDIDSNPSELVTVNGETGTLGSFNGPTQCGTTFTSASYTIPLSTLNTWVADGSINLTLDGGTAVSASLCSSGGTHSIRGYFTISFPYRTIGCSSALTPVNVSVNANPTVAISGTNTICPATSTAFTASGGTSYLWSTGATTATITATTAQTYNVTVTNAAGCTATSNRTLTIANPVAAISGINSICSGTSTTFSASGGSTYLWSTGATTAVITATTAQNYNVTATDVNGCTATSNRTLTVNTNPTAAITGTNAICTGASTTFTASGGSSYLWSTGEVTAAITASTAQIYTVTVTNAAGCTATSNRTLTNVIPAPTVAGSTSICTGLSTSLTASGGSNYNWYCSCSVK
jgi:hypothetical protein